MSERLKTYLAAISDGPQRGRERRTLQGILHTKAGPAFRHALIEAQIDEGAYLGEVTRTTVLGDATTKVVCEGPTLVLANGGVWTLKGLTAAGLRYAVHLLNLRNEAEAPP